MTELWIYVCFSGIIISLPYFTKGYDLYEAQRYREPYSQWNQGPVYRPQTHYQQPQYAPYSQYQLSPQYELRRSQYDSPKPERESGRYIKPQTLYTISETLGALNTVGRYLVNMTRSSKRESGIPEDVPGALYTISKNVLGRNVTDTLAPLVREALPGIRHVTTERPEIPTRVSTALTGNVANVYSEGRSCYTPDGAQGYCDDLSDCPQLLLNLSILRQSLCFKSLFVPGVCCPRDSRPPVTNKPTVLRPISIPTTTTLPPKPQTIQPVAPIIPVTTIPTQVATSTEKPAFTLPPLIVDPLDCGQPENAKFRVVGGEEAPSGKWPWMAAIFLHGPRRTEFWCGGSLITSRHILTAAHCTKDTKQRSFAPRQLTVRLGDIDLKRDDEPSAPVTYTVKEIIAHPEFSRVGYYNDIALLVLDRPVRKSKYVIPLCLPEEDLQTENFAGHTATVVGWGTTYYGGKESTVQRQASLPIWRNEDCNDAYFQPITENFLCAGYSRGGIDACQGDSGGPLMLAWNARWTQVGVVSFGNKCGEPGYPGVYTRVTEFMKWIRDHTKT